MQLHQPKETNKPADAPATVNQAFVPPSGGSWGGAAGGGSSLGSGPFSNWEESFFNDAEESLIFAVMIVIMYLNDMCLLENQNSVED